MTITSEAGKLAAALAAGLNAAEFSKDFDAAVGYGLRLRLEDADTLHVDVAPVRSTAEWETRGSVRWTHIVDIGVRYRFGTAEQDAATGLVTTDAVDAYRYLMQEIVAWCFSHARLVDLDLDVDAAMPGDPEVRADVLAKHFDEWNQFTGLVRVQFQTVADIT